MAINIDWAAAIGGAVVGWMACNKVEDFKSEAKKTVNETAAAAAIAAAQAISDQFQNAGAGGSKSTGNGKDH